MTKNNIKIIDNFLPLDIFTNVKNTIIGTNIDSSSTAWYWQPSITYAQTPESNGQGQFTHKLYDTNIGVQSQLYEFLFSFLMPSLYGEYEGIMLKMKLNLNPQTSTNIMLGEYHNDIKVSKSKTAIFYCNSNNGFTKFETGNIVESVENRMVIFDSSIKHVGYSCTDSQYRLLVNINYILQEQT